MSFVDLGSKPPDVDEFVWFSQKLDQVDRTDWFGGERTYQLTQIHTAAMAEIKARLESDKPSPYDQITKEQAFFEKFQKKTKAKCVQDVARKLAENLRQISKDAEARAGEWATYVSDNVANPGALAAKFGTDSPFAHDAPKIALLANIGKISTAAQTALFSLDPESYLLERKRLYQIVQNAAKLKKDIDANEEMHGTADKVRKMCQARKDLLDREHASQAALTEWNDKSGLQRFKKDPKRAISEYSREHPVIMTGGVVAGVGVAAKAAIIGLTAIEGFLVFAAVCGICCWMSSSKKTA